MRSLLWAAAFVVLGPVAGGLLSGLDRKISARMQRRRGPSLLQPFYDVFKLFEKENVIVNVSQNLYASCFLFFTVFVLYPILQNFANSLTNYDGPSGVHRPGKL
jgi:formate hydrogenlyase subunit 4